MKWGNVATNVGAEAKICCVSPTHEDDPHSYVLKATLGAMRPGATDRLKALWSWEGGWNGKLHERGKGRVLLFVGDVWVSLLVYSIRCITSNCC